MNNPHETKPIHNHGIMPHWVRRHTELSNDAKFFFLDLTRFGDSCTYQQFMADEVNQQTWTDTDINALIKQLHAAKVIVQAEDGTIHPAALIHPTPGDNSKLYGSDE